MSLTSEASSSTAAAQPVHGGAAGAADDLRARGNEHFKAKNLHSAAECYRQALKVLDAARHSGSPEGNGVAALALGQAVRLNLTACLLEENPAEAVRLCSEVL